MITEPLPPDISTNLPDIKKQIGVGLFVWNTITNFLYWDDALFNLFEVDRSEFSNNYSDFKKLLTPLEYSRITDSVKTSIENKTDFINTFKIKVKSGFKYIKAYSSFIDDLLVSVNINITKDEYLKSLEITDLNDYYLIDNKKARLSMFSLRRQFMAASDFIDLDLSHNWVSSTSFGLNYFKYRVLSLDNNEHLQTEWIVLNSTSDTHYHRWSKLITNLGVHPITVWVNGEANIITTFGSIFIPARELHRVEYNNSCHVSVTAFDYFKNFKRTE